MFYSNFPATMQKPVALLEDEWKQPKIVIYRVFDACDFPDLIADARMWITYAFSTQAPPLRKMMAIWQLHRDLLRLLEVATLLEITKTGSSLSGFDPLDPKGWLGVVSKDYVPFDYFPRHLDQADLENPYRVFYACRQLYTLVEWRQRLELLWMHACSPLDMYEFTNDLAIIGDRPLLLQLLEAAHLIFVRELSRKE